MLTVDVSLVKPLLWDFNKPDKTVCDRRTCATQSEIHNYKQNICPVSKDLSLPKDCNLEAPYADMQRALAEKDAALKNVKENVMELKENLKEREKLAATQEETIRLLQNSLSICQKESEDLRKSLKTCQEDAEDLHRVIDSLKLKKVEAEKDCKKQVQGFQNKISDLENNLKQSQDMTLQMRGGVGALCKMMFSELKAQYLQTIEEGMREDQSLRILQNANLELATLAGHLQEDYRCAQLKLSNLYQQISDSQKKHQKAEAALQVVVSNLKEKLRQNGSKLHDLQKENKDLKEELENIKTNVKKESEEYNKRVSVTSQETQEKIGELRNQARIWARKVEEMEAMLKKIEQKLNHSTSREQELEQQLSLKESKYKDEICEKQRETIKLRDMMKSMTEKLNETSTDLDAERVKHCETEKKLQTVCSAYDDLKLKAKEKETTAEKLQVALTQLSNKFVTRRLDSKGCIRHYQEECAKFEALYNTSSCKLRMKEQEVCSLKQENEQLKNELEHLAASSSLQQENDTCPYLMERVNQLSRELQVALSCQNSYEALLKDLKEKGFKKEEEIACLKLKLKERDTLVFDLETAQDEISRLKMENSDLHNCIKKVEHSKAELTDQMRNMQRMMVDSQSPTGGIKPNIELQREISTVLSSQLRGTKQKLITTRQDYKLLQAAYEELNKKYSLLQMGERDEEGGKDLQPGCQYTPCRARSSKSFTQAKYSENPKDKPLSKYSTHSTSWHRIEGNGHEHKEIKWKEKLRAVMIEHDFEPETLNNSSSSN